MLVLIYSPDSVPTEPLQRMLRQWGIHVDLAESEEHFRYLSMTESYAAVLCVERGSHERLAELFTAWKKEGCRSPFIVLSERQSGLDRARALELGVDHYLIAPYSYTELIRTICLSEYKKQLQERSSIKTEHFELDVLSRMVFCGGQRLSLTKTEFELLSLLVRRRGTVLSRVQIWEEIWGYQDYALGNTIDVHMNRLRKKLPPAQRDLIITVYGIGYRMHEQA